MGTIGFCSSQNKHGLRNTTTNERLKGLAQMHINDDTELSVDEVTDTFASQNSTRMQFLDIFKDGDSEK